MDPKELRRRLEEASEAAAPSRTRNLRQLATRFLEGGHIKDPWGQFVAGTCLIRLAVVEDNAEVLNKTPVR